MVRDLQALQYNKNAKIHRSGIPANSTCERNCIGIVLQRILSFPFFKEKMGMTIRNNSQKRRLHIQQSFLNTTELTMEQIADQLGFSCPYSIRRAFKKYVGLTPGDYKRTQFLFPKITNNYIVYSIDF
jgi:hypothetical protein